MESLPSFQTVVEDLVGVALPEVVLARVLPKSSRLYYLLREEAGRRGWRYGRPSQLPLQHRVVVAVAGLVLSAVPPETPVSRSLLTLLTLLLICRLMATRCGGAALHSPPFSFLFAVPH